MKGVLVFGNDLVAFLKIRIAKVTLAQLVKLSVRTRTQSSNSCPTPKISDAAHIILAPLDPLPVPHEGS